MGAYPMPCNFCGEDTRYMPTGMCDNLNIAKECKLYKMKENIMNMSEYEIQSIEHATIILSALLIKIQTCKERNTSIHKESVIDDISDIRYYLNKVN